MADPVFTPAGRSFTSSIAVTITTTTSGASIRYTVDGSSPTEESGNLYSGPVTITASTTFKAIAYKSGMTSSSIVSATYTQGSGAADVPTVLSVTPSETYGGVIAIRAGNSIRAELTPSTALVHGTTVRTDQKLITNTVPQVANVRINPTNPNSSSTLTLMYDFVDPDLFTGEPGQSANPEIIWYRSNNGGASYDIVQELSGYLSDPNHPGSATVAPSYLNAGQFWKARITPCDGIDCGTAVTASAVYIRAS
jgi:hypothetical protein